MYDEFFAKAHELIEKGEPFATATVVRAEKPTSGKPGDKAIVTLGGVMYGWIGGSCAQPTAAVDPVCGMTVRTRDATHTHEHLGTVFYFSAT